MPVKKSESKNRLFMAEGISEPTAEREPGGEVAKDKPACQQTYQESDQQPDRQTTRARQF